MAYYAQAFFICFLYFFILTLGGGGSACTVIKHFAPQERFARYLDWEERTGGLSFQGMRFKLSMVAVCALFTALASSTAGFRSPGMRFCLITSIVLNFGFSWFLVFFQTSGSPRSNGDGQGHRQ